MRMALNERGGDTIARAAGFARARRATAAT
jgi:hypothetical protein